MPAKQPLMQKPYLVGIIGGSGSGKTYFLNRLLEGLGAENACLISQDHYYKPKEEQPIDQNGWVNFDLPQSIDEAAFTNDIRRLLRGEEVVRQEYTFNNAEKVPEQLLFSPRPVIIIEGLFVCSFLKVSEMLDLRVFIETKMHLKIKRRIIRDSIERGYDLDDVLYRYEHHVAPAYEKYVAPYRDEADLIVPNNTTCDTAANVLVNHLNTFFNR